MDLDVSSTGKSLFNKVPLKYQFQIVLPTNFAIKGIDIDKVQALCIGVSCNSSFDTTGIPFSSNTDTAIPISFNGVTVTLKFIESLTTTNIPMVATYFQAWAAAMFIKDNDGTSPGHFNYKKQYAKNIEVNLYYGQSKYNSYNLMECFPIDVFKFDYSYDSGEPVFYEITLNCSNIERTL